MGDMPRKILVALLVLALAACATSKGPSASNEGAGSASSGSSASASGWAVAIIGTPFVLGFKTAVCAATVAVAGPIAGILALGADPYDRGLEILGDGVAQNCGGPYVVSPTAAS
jgi:hypothetical protein